MYTRRVNCPTEVIFAIELYFSHLQKLCSNRSALSWQTLCGHKCNSLNWATQSSKKKKWVSKPFPYTVNLVEYEGTSLQIMLHLVVPFLFVWEIWHCYYSQIGWNQHHNPLVSMDHIGFWFAGGSVLMVVFALCTLWGQCRVMTLHYVNASVEPKVWHGTEGYMGGSIILCKLTANTKEKLGQIVM
jgi:hypothetical protein